ncbi:MAG TPA: DUF6174 domain-containing protein, partial [Pirellulales bacterium]|nr:DUF6174 domain-containing protein [Pirellulales bacterium]
MDESDDSAPRPSTNGDSPSGAEASAAAARVVRPPRRRVRASKIVAGVILGVGAGALVALIATLAWLRPGAAELNEDELARAEKLWRETAPADYDVDVRVTGRQPGEYHVEVRRGRPVLAARNGIATPQRVWDVWTVDGMFDTIHQEIENAQDPAGPFGSPPGSQVVERAAFDDRFGYPRRYQRIVMGTELEIAWEVVEFRAFGTNGG